MRGLWPSPQSCLDEARETWRWSSYHWSCGPGWLRQRSCLRSGLPTPEVGLTRPTAALAAAEGALRSGAGHGHHPGICPDIQAGPDQSGADKVRYRTNRDRAANRAGGLVQGVHGP